MKGYFGKKICIFSINNKDISVAQRHFYIIPTIKKKKYKKLLGNLKLKKIQNDNCTYFITLKVEYFALVLEYDGKDRSTLCFLKKEVFVKLSESNLNLASKEAYEF